ncbi:MAG: membrane protein insertion efficiency factor YidD [Myxococcales bacterium]|nr:membrane protein insertion efficiency factor YidD [Myxococcales bacterium]
MLAALVTVVLTQVAPGPFSAPLAPTFPEPAPEAVATPEARPTFLQTIARGAYGAYRATLSTAKGSNCNFSPSCSVYGHQAIETVGLVPGLLLFGARLMRGHVNFDRFYRFDGARLVDPLDDTLAWLTPREEDLRWYWLRSRSR